MQQSAIDAMCSRPDLISTTRLRKYTATVTQILGLKSGELEWLGNHLGHTVEIHKDSYRLHESTIEMAKVSKVLLAIKSGTARNFKGKSLDEIELDDVKLPEDNNDDGSDDEFGVGSLDNSGEERMDVAAVSHEPSSKEKKGKKRKPPKCDKREKDSKKCKVQEPKASKSRPKRKIKKVTNYDMSEETSQDDSFLDEHYVTESDDESITDSGHDSLLSEKSNTKVSKSKKSWIKWSKEEIHFLQIGFQRNIMNGRVPRKADAERVMDKYPTLKKRTWTQIKSKVQNLIKQKDSIRGALLEKAKDKM
ncbi:uncharacterized protein LOC135501856 [Lineus longissimus]|uniref:uncharacterized protein LOC135501856 n=1 Tax=Lineus longissimus TaxID=88925 RepID=UPI00315DD600